MDVSPGSLMPFFPYLSALPLCVFLGFSLGTRKLAKLKAGNKMNKEEGVVAGKNV